MVIVNTVISSTDLSLSIRRYSGQLAIQMSCYADLSRTWFGGRVKSRVLWYTDDEAQIGLDIVTSSPAGTYIVRMRDRAINGQASNRQLSLAARL